MITMIINSNTHNVCLQVCIYIYTYREREIIDNEVSTLLRSGGF